MGNEVKPVISDVEDFFSEDSLNKPIQLRVGNVPTGNHILKLESFELKKARINEKTKIPGTDRFEALFEVLESDNPKCVVGNKATVPFFKDENGYGEKGICMLAQQGNNDTKLRNGSEAVRDIRSHIGDAIECHVAQKIKAGVPLTTKKGEPILEYAFGAFAKF